MNFPFDPIKTLQAAGRLLQNIGDSMHMKKLGQLIYLAERQSIETRGIPIFGGNYVSLPQGPFLVECLNLMSNQGHAGQHHWNAAILNQGAISLLISFVDTDHLALSELRIIDSIRQTHGNKTPGELRAWCENLPEYQKVTVGRKPITLKEIGGAVKTDVRVLTEEAQAANFLSKVFAQR